MSKKTASAVDKLIKKYTLKDMRSICQKRKIPYVSLRKKQVAENMVAYKQKKPFPHKIKAKSIKEEREANHKITPAIRSFCFDYAMAIKPRTQKQWAKRFGVNEATIYKWLQWEQVNNLIERFQLDREARINHLFEAHEADAFNSLLAIVQSGDSDEIKLKAINDFFGYTGRINSNRAGGAKLTVNQLQQNKNQAQQANSPFANLTDDAIDAEIVELDTLLLEEKRNE